MAAVSEAAPGAMLELRDVDAGYGPFRALFRVSLSVPVGSTSTLMPRAATSRA